MKRLIAVLLIMITTNIAQEVFTPQTLKPPAEMPRFEIQLIYLENEVRDSLGVVVPDTFTVTYVTQYNAYLQDEDGNSVRTSKTKGNLMPYLTTTEKNALKAFMDAQVAKAQALIP